MLLDADAHEATPLEDADRRRVPGRRRRHRVHVGLAMRIVRTTTNPLTGPESTGPAGRSGALDARPRARTPVARQATRRSRAVPAEEQDPRQNARHARGEVHREGAMGPSPHRHARGSNRRGSCTAAYTSEGTYFRGADHKLGCQRTDAGAEVTLVACTVRCSQRQRGQFRAARHCSTNSGPAFIAARSLLRERENRFRLTVAELDA